MDLPLWWGTKCPLHCNIITLVLVKSWWGFEYIYLHNYTFKKQEQNERIDQNVFYCSTELYVDSWVAL